MNRMAVSQRTLATVMTFVFFYFVCIFLCWLVLTERGHDLSIKEVRAVCVDGKDILPDTFYMLVDGKVVPAE